MSRYALGILMLMCICPPGDTADDLHGARPHREHRFGARVAYPSISVQGVATAGYWVKGIAYLVGQRRSTRETLLFVPFGGLYHLSSATNLGVGIVQTVKLKRSALDTHGPSLAIQAGLSVLTLAGYGVTLGVGATEMFSFEGTAPLGEMMVLTAGMMTANLVFTIAAFRWRTDTLLQPSVEPRRVMVAPVIGVSEHKPVLGLQAHFTL